MRGEPRADTAVLHLCRFGRFLSRWSGLRSLLVGGSKQHPKMEDDPEEQIFGNLWEDETQREMVVERLKADREVRRGGLSVGEQRARKLSSPIT